MEMRDKTDEELWAIVASFANHTAEEVGAAAWELERRGYTVYKEGRKP